MKNKVTNVFLYSLAIISILGFLAIVMATYFNSYFLSMNQAALILLVLGIGLMIEGKIKSWNTMSRNGINSTELAHIITGIVGIIAVISGLLSLFGVQNATVSQTKGIIAIVAIVVIVIETWVVE